MDPEGAEIVGPYKKKHRLTFPHLLDPDCMVSGEFGVRGTPTNYLQDREGRVVAAAVGYRDFDSPEAHALIEALLEEPMGKGSGETQPPQALPKG